jgi:hypothetical protein
MTIMGVRNVARADLAPAPQPLPGKAVGEMVGREILRVSWIAKHLGVEFDVLADWDDELCPPWPNAPIVPKHVWPFPLPEPDAEWVRAYHFGLSLTLAQAEGWQRHASIVREALGKSTRALSESMA